MTQLNIFDAAPQSVTVQPIARAARRSGRQSVAPGTAMLAYRDALQRYGPATDHEMAARLGWGVSSVNGRRGDWNGTAPADRPLVVAVDRVKVGRASRARWVWRE